jgi:hypothetical protein
VSALARARFCESIPAGRGKLGACYESLTRKDGSVTHEWLWHWAPNDGLGERRFVGVVAEMTEAEALEIAGQL